MAFQIDQSGKIEQTQKDTVLCLSNDQWYAVIIQAKTKRQLQEIFRRCGRTRNFVLFTFCAGISILLKRNPDLQQVTIDKEYPGKKPILKNILYQMLKREKRTPDMFFARIGKKALAHHRAYAVGLGRLKAQKVVGIKEILKEIKMTEVGKRLKNA